jgi:hypothetical protein
MTGSIARALCAGLMLAVLAVGSAHAMAIQVVSGGQLIGARNVDVGGALYDVEFIDGSCAALFGGCDAVSDFTFTTLADATAAARALLDQVLLDTVLGDFDSDYTLTQGCETNGFANCGAMIPFGFTPNQAQVRGRAPRNFNGSDSINTFVFTRGDDFADNGREFLVFARFTPSIPEPATLLLFATGLGGLAGLRRVRRRAD